MQLCQKSHICHSNKLYHYAQSYIYLLFNKACNSTHFLKVHLVPETSPFTPFELVATGPTVTDTLFIHKRQGATGLCSMYSSLVLASFVLFYTETSDIMDMVPSRHMLLFSQGFLIFQKSNTVRNSSTCPF